MPGCRNRLICGALMTVNFLGLCKPERQSKDASKASHGEPKETAEKSSGSPTCPGEHMAGDAEEGLHGVSQRRGRQRLRRA